MANFANFLAKLSEIQLHFRIDGVPFYNRAAAAQVIGDRFGSVLLTQLGMIDDQRIEEYVRTGAIRPAIWTLKSVITIDTSQFADPNSPSYRHHSDGTVCEGPLCFRCARISEIEQRERDHFENIKSVNNSFGQYILIRDLADYMSDDCDVSDDGNLVARVCDPQSRDNDFADILEELRITDSPPAEPQVAQRADQSEDFPLYHFDGSICEGICCTACALTYAYPFPKPVGTPGEPEERADSGFGDSACK